MDRKIYIAGKVLSLAEYLPIDQLDDYNDWQDMETKMGYNHQRAATFEEFKQREIKQRLYASVILNVDRTLVGWIGVSPESSPPDLAVRIYRPYRKRSYGTMAFQLGVEYCFTILELNEIYAGCYPHNQGSRKIIERCGFVRHPAGDMEEKHFLTGEDIVQHDFVLYNPNCRGDQP